MKFIEFSMPQNADHPTLPGNVLLSIDGILEIFVRALSPQEMDARRHDYGLFIIHQSRQLRFHGTKSDCERSYKDLHVLLNQALSDTEMKGIVGTLTFPVRSMD